VNFRISQILTARGQHLIKITIDAKVYEALSLAFPKPANSAHRALAKYIRVLENKLFKSLHFAATPLQQKLDLFTISLKELANEGGQIGAQKMVLHRWLRENNLSLMHRVLKQATARPPASNMLQQQDKFESFMQEYNYERPHEGIQMKTPASLYEPSTRIYKGLPELQYPFHDRTVVITECGRICLDRRKISVSTVLGGQKVGIKQVDDQIWQVSFMEYDLGYFDMDSCRIEPGPNPFGPKLLTM
jgi:hypothetical protein